MDTKILEIREAAIDMAEQYNRFFFHPYEIKTLDLDFNELDGERQAILLALQEYNYCFVLKEQGLVVPNTYFTTPSEFSGICEALLNNEETEPIKKPVDHNIHNARMFAQIAPLVIWNEEIEEKLTGIGNQDITCHRFNFHSGKWEQFEMTGREVYTYPDQHWFVQKYGNNFAEQGHFRKWLKHAPVPSQEVWEESGGRTCLDFECAGKQTNCTQLLRYNDAGEIETVDHYKLKWLIEGINWFPETHTAPSVESVVRIGSLKLIEEAVNVS